MSFILDALKKSESERQRQNGPALFEVKIAPPRHRFAVWAIALGALLAINLVVVVWLYSRGTSTRSAASVSASAPAPAASGATGVSAAVAPVPEQRSVVPAGAVSSSGARVSSAAVAAAGSGVASTPPTGVASQTIAGGPSVVEASRAAGASDAVHGSDAASTNPADLAPAVEPPRDSAAADGSGSVVRESSSGLPTYQDAAAMPGADLPQLQLDLHVYSDKPDQRFVFLNMVKLHEGESLPQGVRVDAITPEGVILSFRGTKFVLQQATP